MEAINNNRNLQKLKKAMQQINLFLDIYLSKLIQQRVG